MKHLAYDFGSSKSTVSDTITQVENVLIKSGVFRLPGKKALLSQENEGKTFVVDVTESPIMRPKKAEKVVFGQEKATHHTVSIKGAKSLRTRRRRWCVLFTLVTGKR